MTDRTLIVSIFPGIDLLGRAFEEVWPEACLLRGLDALWGRDVRQFHLPPEVIHVIIGGPPCQQFSPLVHLLRAIGREPKHPNLMMGRAGAWAIRKATIMQPIEIS